MEFTFSRRQLTRALFLVVFVLTALQIVMFILQLRYGAQYVEPMARFLKLDAEGNLPTFFSSSLLLVSSILCAFAGQLASSRKASLSFHWYLLACAFGFLAVDEAAQLHEFVDNLIRRVWTNRGVLQWPWVIPYVLAAGSVAVICVPFLRRLPRAIAWRFVAAGVVYVTGAAGLDMLEGGISHFVRAGVRNLGPLLASVPVIEEPLEMIGVILLIDAILRYLEVIADAIRIRVTS
jgi:hypothetical protein